MLQVGGSLLHSRGAFMNQRGVIFLQRDDIRYRQEGCQSGLRGTFAKLGARRSRGVLQVRDSPLIGRRGATTGSRGTFMNRWAPFRARGAVFSKRNGIRHWQEGHQPGWSATFTKL